MFSRRHPVVFQFSRQNKFLAACVCPSVESSATRAAFVRGRTV